MDPMVFKSLNKEQKAAVECVKGPSVILAGAGSGKTRVLVQKVLNLVLNNKVDPSEIAMITFTNKAANEMKERIFKHLSTDKKSGTLGYIGTFHSFCCRILRRESHFLGYDHDFAIYDSDDQSSLMKMVVKKLELKKSTPSYYIHRISAAKNQLITPEKYLGFISDYAAAATAEVYTEYQKELLKNKAMDFDDLIFNTVRLFMKYQEVLKKYHQQYKYLLVDEFQDTNYAQYVLTRILARKYRNVTVVGDFSQSIYAWRGADIRNLETFQQDFPQAKVYYLDQNYRSTQNILDFAYEVISINETHPILKLRTTIKAGEEITYYEAENEEAEARYVAEQIELLREQYSYNNFAVLYRTNAQSRALEEAFLHYSIPYALYGGVRFYERKEIKDILSYLRLFINPDDEVALERIKKLGKKYWREFQAAYPELAAERKDLSTTEIIDKIFQVTGYLSMYDQEDEEDYSRLENIKELKSVAGNFPDLVAFLEQIALVESEYFEGERRRGRNKDGVKLMTLHQAKGLEFPIVFITGLEEGVLPHVRSLDDRFQMEEERRLFYVGITRAMKRLFITNARRRFVYGRRGDGMKSRFIGGADDPVATWDSW